MVTEKPNETSHGHASLPALAIGVLLFEGLESMAPSLTSRRHREHPEVQS
jgi:hypothetical protein